MGKIAFVFAGQGAQHPGMGQELCEISPAAKAVFQRLDGIRPGTSQQCFSGTGEELSETKNTQPCMFAVEMAAAAALTEAGIRADVAAGFSLGELAALTYAGAADLEAGFRLVCRRGLLMQEAAEVQPTAMVAVLRLEPTAVEALCQRFEQVYPVNYNCPGQIVISGKKAAVEEACEKLKAAGAKRAIMLNVSGPFHSGMLTGAGEKLGKVLENVEIHEPSIPYVANVTAQYVTSAEPVKELLVKQVSSSVRWQQSVEAMIADGVDTFIEIGPGKTLAGFMRKINKGVKTLNVEKWEDIDKAVEALGQ